MITLDACGQSTCENRFLVHSSNEEYLEQLVFKAGVPLIDTGIIKNTCVSGKVPLGIAFNSDHRYAVLVPIGFNTSKDLKDFEVSITHDAQRSINLWLIYPKKGISVEPIR